MNSSSDMHRQKGSVLVELAILGTVLIVLVFGVIEMGRVLVQQNELTESVESSARYLARGYQALNDDCTEASSWVGVKTRALNILLYGSANSTTGEPVVPNLTSTDVTVAVKSVTLVSQPISTCVVEVAAQIEYDGLFDVFIPLTNLVSATLNAKSEERYIGE